jgi:hypothetical protein
MYSHVVLVVWSVVCVVGLNVAVVTAEPAIDCSSFGCYITGGVKPEFIEELRQKDNLNENPVTLDDFATEDLATIVDTLKDDLRLLSLKSKTITDITPLAKLKNCILSASRFLM